LSEIYVDPEKLRDFARLVRKFSSDADNSLRIISGELGRLQGSWRDQDFEKFAGHVRRTQDRLKVFATETAKVVPALERDAEAIEAYRRLQVPE
jgi:uncharacterized protein YukE